MDLEKLRRLRSQLFRSGRPPLAHESWPHTLKSPPVLLGPRTPLDLGRAPIRGRIWSMHDNILTMVWPALSLRRFHWRARAQCIMSCRLPPRALHQLQASHSMEPPHDSTSPACWMASRCAVTLSMHWLVPVTGRPPFTLSLSLAPLRRNRGREEKNTVGFGPGHGFCSGRD
jgi:hypothetical protein